VQKHFHRGAPEYWQLFLGLIFIIVTCFTPRVMGLLRRGDR
jgi:ABC-type branched-subunit amino acid transport system permease subunit